MTERIASGFHPFVLPFLFGMAFVLGYCVYGVIKILHQLSFEERKKFFISLVTPKTMLKNVKDIFLDCLIHVKLWKRNRLLGFMHSSIAFGWFMLIVLGHIEVMFYLPDRLKTFYYPIFFNFFVAEGESTIGGSVFFFLMDFFLAVILCGIVLAIIKRVRSHLFGMRRTTRLSALDTVGLYALWAIFPLRLLAEGFTASISGGSFLTVPLDRLFHYFLGNDMNLLPTWWAYSIALCVFMVVLPFTRYMHIPAEMLLIPMRNAGLKIVHARKGFARVMVYSCPNCGVCIDACPMSVKKANTRDTTVYLNRQIRRGNEKRIEEISDKCLLCGKCSYVCQIGIEAPKIRIAQRAHRKYSFSQDFSNIPTAGALAGGVGTAGFSGGGVAGFSAGFSGSGVAGFSGGFSGSGVAGFSGGFSGVGAAGFSGGSAGFSGEVAGVGGAPGSGVGAPGSAVGAPVSGVSPGSAVGAPVSGAGVPVSGVSPGSAVVAPGGGKVLYFAGCMTQLTPRIGKAVESVLKKAGVGYSYMDRDGGLCCGRPLMTAGRIDAAAQLVAKNTEIILASGCDTLLLSCPICYKIFNEKYKLPGIRVVHHSVFFNELLLAGKLRPAAAGSTAPAAAAGSSVAGAAGAAGAVGAVGAVGAAAGASSATAPTGSTGSTGATAAAGSSVAGAAGVAGAVGAAAAGASSATAPTGSTGATAAAGSYSQSAAAGHPQSSAAVYSQRAGTIVFHDPCELGRGSGIYDQPRELLRAAGPLVEAAKSREESICCGGSIGSLSLSFDQREALTRNALKNLTVANPARIATACPLCLATFSRYSDRPVQDLAEIIDEATAEATAKATAESIAESTAESTV